MANAISFWRKKRKISQQKLADLIGIHRPILSNIENPNIPIDPDEKMAKKFDYQIWLERVAIDKFADIVLVDGEIKK